jgi:acyl-coenzyme A thioesterase PaaI-like protein
VTDETGTVFAEGRIIHRGNRTAITGGRLTDAAGTLCAYAVTTSHILS